MEITGDGGCYLCQKVVSKSKKSYIDTLSLSRDCWLGKTSLKPEKSQLDVAYRFQDTEVLLGDVLEIVIYALYNSFIMYINVKLKRLNSRANASKVSTREYT